MEIEDLETASFKNNINLCLLQKVSVCYVENSTEWFTGMYPSSSYHLPVSFASVGIQVSP